MEKLWYYIENYGTLIYMEKLWYCTENYRTLIYNGKLSYYTQNYETSIYCRKNYGTIQKIWNFYLMSKKLRYYTKTFAVFKQLWL